MCLVLLQHLSQCCFITLTHSRHSCAHALHLPHPKHSAHFSCVTGVGRISPADHLSTCESQLGDFLDSMGSTLNGITGLQVVVLALPSELGVSHREWDRDPEDYLCESFFDPEDQESVQHIPAAVCSVLMSKLHNLQRLTLRGLCEDVGLSAFGANCPQLSFLMVEARLVPAESLDGIHRWFPNLNHFAISTRGPLSREDCQIHPEETSTHVVASLPFLRGCKKLKVLQLDMVPDRPVPNEDWLVSPDLEVFDKAWKKLPHSLEDFRCDVPISDLPHMSSLLSRLRCLTLAKFPFDNLSDLLQKAPVLEYLSVSEQEDDVYLMSGADMKVSKIDRFKAWLLAGFQLRCESVMLVGSAQAILEVMEWMSPLLDTTVCGVSLVGAIPTINSLERFLKKFPALLELDIWTREVESPLLEGGFVKLLAGNLTLKKLAFHMRIGFTVKGLVSLCKSPPALRSLILKTKVTDKCRIAVNTALTAQDRVVNISDGMHPYIYK